MDIKDIIAYFDRCASEWDVDNAKDAAKISRILDAARIGEGAAVLDIACGTGVLFPFYLERGVSRITGADISSQMVKRCLEKFGGDRRIEVLCADAQTTPFPTDYDACMVFNAFPHFCEPEALLRNLSAALKSGGTLTVAHDRSREEIDRHHSGTAQRVSCGLLHEEKLAAMMLSSGLSEVQAITDSGVYIVTGVKS